MNKWNTSFLIMAAMFLQSCGTIDPFKPVATGYQTSGDAHWTISEDGICGSVEGGAGFLYSQGKYKDFELRFEFNPDSTINSGIFIRCTGNEVDPMSCYEVNIWDRHPRQEWRTGSVVLKANPLQEVHTIGKWNDGRIMIRGSVLQVWINRVKTAELSDAKLPAGKLVLQAAENGNVCFRNWRLRSF